MTSLRDTLDSDDYAEFGLLRENAAEWDIPFTGQPVVSRESLRLPSGQALSYLRWGEGEPELVFLHGGAQNGQTWDTVMLALGRSAVAVDLPGHEHSEAMAGEATSISAMQNAMPIDILEPEDIADAVAFLVSDQAKWITGVALPVDAGFCVR
jgi:hypothetical protein